ncbi:hypothetical protein HMPREF9193_00850 [Treponema lecithinolyticum ATCC 700332]|uniref:Uncharacterized protein n=1 Tax=Treponema lecithinolyticum ATCC 700332 TaxID=1321815 RepID=A0ABN0NZW6_TRELE|nr:hypothetical protein HMPREF9193_00850 [Treponema lecithinolyticum ATCC 700332]
MAVSTPALRLSKAFKTTFRCCCTRSVTLCYNCFYVARSLVRT